MMKKTQHKLTYITRTLMMVMTSILIILFFVIISLVGQIQGTARVVNYAGLVRGETQRMIKLEDAEEPQDKMMNTISSYIQGLREGSNDLNLVCLDDKDFQNKMEELDSYFEELKKRFCRSVRMGMRIRILSRRVRLFSASVMRQLVMQKHILSEKLQH